MFKVKTYLNKSNIHGIGLFSFDNIKKGKIIYIPNKKLDLFIKNNDFNKLLKYEKDFIKHYGYKSKDGNYHLAYDDIRFCNHSESNNNISIDNKGYIYAIKDIKKDEELLQNYSEFESLRKKLK